MVIAASSLTGLLMAERLAERCRKLRQWLQILELLQTEIYYHNDLLPEVLARIAVTVPDRSLAERLVQLAQRLSFGSEYSVAEAWTILTGQLAAAGMEPSDNRILQELGQYLGSTERTDQMQKIKACQNRLEGNLARAEQESERRTRIYRYLGFAAGAIIVLWLI